jgi:hypothetical protein
MFTLRFEKLEFDDTVPYVRMTSTETMLVRTKIFVP